MSDLVKSNDAALLSLAEELGIDLTQSAVAESGSSLYTSYQAPEGVRALIDAHKTDTIRWNVPGETKEFSEQLYYQTSDGSLNEFGPLHTIRGIIVDYSQRDQLDYYDGQKTNLLCSVIGYGYPNDPKKDLPKVAYGNKYVWTKTPEGKNVLDRNQPAAVVERLGLVGQRGGKPTPCSECIFNGLSTEEYRDEKGEVRIAECQPRAKVHIVVYSVGKITKKRPVRGQDPVEQVEWRDIKDLVDEQGTPFTGPILVQVNLSRSFIQGRWNEDPNVSIVGMEGYFRNLDRNYKGANARKNPLFNWTTVRFKQNPKAPIFNPHFEEQGSPSTEEIREAKALWNSSVPVRTAVSLTVEDFNAASIKSASLVDVPSLPEYVTDDDDDDVITTVTVAADQSPF